MARYIISQTDAYLAAIERGPGRTAEELRAALWGEQTYEQEAYKPLRLLVEQGHVEERKEGQERARYFVKGTP